MFLNSTQKIFINTGFVVDLPLVKIALYPFFSSANISYNLGVGYKIKKWSAEFRYYQPRSIIDNYSNIGTIFKKRSLVLSYTF